jgi:hypothetical protein
LSDVWSALGALSAATGTLIIAVAAVYGYLQVREAKLARTIDTVLAVYQQYHDQQLKSIRRRLLARQLGDLSQLSDGPEKQALDDLLSLLELLSILIDRRFLDIQLVATVLPVLRQVWEEATPYILRQRQVVPHYALHLERLVRRLPGASASSLPATTQE